MVLVVTQHNLPKPRTDIGHAIMHPALKLNLDGFKLRNYSLFRSNPPYGEGSALVALPTVVGEAQEREGLWFSLSPLLPVSSHPCPSELALLARLCGASVRRGLRTRDKRPPERVRLVHSFRRAGRGS